MAIDEDLFNQQIRKFLKKVGITSQREIEKAVRQALESGRFKGDETLSARVTLEVPDAALKVAIEDTIKLS